MAKKNLKIETEYNTDIEKAALIPTLLFRMYGWQWPLSASAPDKVPNEQEIEQHIEGLVKRVLEGEHDEISSGRFRVRFINDGMVDSIEILLDLATIHDQRVQ